MPWRRRHRPDDRRHAHPHWGVQRPVSHRPPSWSMVAGKREALSRLATPPLLRSHGRRPSGSSRELKTRAVFAGLTLFNNLTCLSAMALVDIWSIAIEHE